jgi:hypothetical protein
MRDYGIPDEHHDVVASCFPTWPPQVRHLGSILILLDAPFHLCHVVIIVGDDPALVKLQDRGSVSADRVQGGHPRLVKTTLISVLLKFGFFLIQMSLPQMVSRIAAQD